jgi:hypothetical protein
MDCRFRRSGSACFKLGFFIVCPGRVYLVDVDTKTGEVRERLQHLIPDRSRVVGRMRECR